MENNNYPRKENEKVNEILLKRPPDSRSGRKGDERMNRALAAKLANPNLLLSEALRIGGFEYPSDDDSNSIDADAVRLAQRKNQLSRRIRMAKQHFDQEKTQQLHSDTKPTRTGFDTLKTSNIGLPNLATRTESGSNTMYPSSIDPNNILSTALQSSAFTNVDPSTDNTKRGVIQGIWEMNGLDQWNTTHQSNKPSDAFPADVSSSYHRSVAGLAVAPSGGNGLPNQVRIEKYFEDDYQASLLNYAAVQKALLNSDGGQSTLLGQNIFANRQAKRSYTDFVSANACTLESSIIGNQIRDPIGFPNPTDGLGDIRDRLGSREAQQSAYYENLTEMYTGTPEDPVTSRQAVALRLFESRAKDVYMGCMRDAGYASKSIETAESSQEYCQFVIASWIQQGHYVQSLLTEEMKCQIPLSNMPATVPTPQHSILNLSGPSIPNSLYDANAFASTANLQYLQGRRNVPLAGVQNTVPHTNIIRSGIANNYDEASVYGKYNPLQLEVNNHVTPISGAASGDLQRSGHAAIATDGMTTHEKAVLNDKMKNSLPNLSFQAVDCNQATTGSIFTDEDSDAILQVFDES